MFTANTQHLFVFFKCTKFVLEFKTSKPFMRWNKALDSGNKADESFF